MTHANLSNIAFAGHKKYEFGFGFMFYPVARLLSIICSFKNALPCLDYLEIRQVFTLIFRCKKHTQSDDSCFFSTTKCYLE